MVEWSMLFFFAVSSIVEMEAKRFIPSSFLKHFETDWRIFDGLRLRSDSNAKFRIRIVMRRFWKCEGFPAMPCHIRTCIKQKRISFAFYGCHLKPFFLASSSSLFCQIGFSSLNETGTSLSIAAFFISIEGVA